MPVEIPHTPPVLHSRRRGLCTVDFIGASQLLKKQIIVCRKLDMYFFCTRNLQFICLLKDVYLLSDERGIFLKSLTQLPPELFFPTNCHLISLACSRSLLYVPLIIRHFSSTEGYKTRDNGGLRVKIIPLRSLACKTQSIKHFSCYQLLRGVLGTLGV